MARSRLTRQRSRPRLGQHFLRDQHIRRRILELLDSREDDCWLEIGPGHGEMTEGLAGRSRGLIAVERDPQLAAGLRERLGGQRQVVEADFLEVNLVPLAQGVDCERLRVYGNLPYYITSPILRHLFDSLAVIQDIHVVVQREVAERLVAAPGGRDYGYLSVLAQFHTAAEILLVIPPGAFQPPPKVESALVRLRPPGTAAELKVGEPGPFLAFASACFRHKRKTLRNNLRGTYTAVAVSEALAAARLDPRARAEEMSLADFTKLFSILAEGEKGDSSPCSARGRLPRRAQGQAGRRG
jgi:16S rRNA (adenine1518-N6/adenine1519-N6)-dimethyltransferase